MILSQRKDLWEHFLYFYIATQEAARNQAAEMYIWKSTFTEQAFQICISSWKKNLYFSYFNQWH